jgi:hypothetical protein
MMVNWMPAGSPRPLLTMGANQRLVAASRALWRAAKVKRLCRPSSATHSRTLSNRFEQMEPARCAVESNQQRIR